MNKLYRAGAALLLGVVATARADIPPPPLCEQLHLVVDSLQRPFTADDSNRYIDELAARSGLQLQRYEPVTENLQAFAAGALDAWFGARIELLEHADALLLEPAYWQDTYLLWFRAGELSSLVEWPQLSGLRGGYWPGQEKRGLLIPLEGSLRQQDMLQLDNMAVAIEALFAGQIDFILSDERSLQAVLPAPYGMQDLESLAMPVASESYYLALSKHSACNDPATAERLAGAIGKLRESRAFIDP